MQLPDWSQPKPDFPDVLDSSMRGEFVSCPQKFFRRYIQHWSPTRKSVHLRAGGAFAAALETTRRAYWEAGLSPEISIANGAGRLLREYGEASDEDLDGPKSPQTMLIALDDYFREHGWDTDPIQPLRLPNGKLALEFSFAIPIPGTSHPQTGDPILYAGRFDMLGIFNDSLFVVDEKTTTQLGPSWSKQWTLRSQLTGYCWAARQFNHPVAGAIIRGVSVQKSGIKHATVIEYRPEWQIERWLRQLQRDVQRMIDCWRTSEWDFALDHACADFGGCPFQEVCTSNNPDRWLEANFERRVWSPLRIQEDA